MFDVDTFGSSLVVIAIVFMALFDGILYFLFKVRLAHSRRNIIGIILGTLLLLSFSLIYERENESGEVIRGWPVGYLVGGNIDYFKLICGLLFYSLFVLDGFTIIKIFRMKVFKKKR
ncbi:hypothetical protein KC675_05365 [Candidatus Dojkabacteria bacterium]|uniref:Uncharacterized protein n=1 Tax=Candidatus Dojkabacteria bacterium TaxID=2099670 RepID=A0A955I850_9BACT|nr:hypothetical protein [Candidatus Dojkabacteria bacterium]